MIHYILKDAAGKITQRGTCADEDEIPRNQGTSFEVVEAADPRRPTQHPEPGYKDYRMMDYPSVGDQLDALWKIVEAAGLLSRDKSGIFDRVQAVKKNYPKAG